MQCVLGLHEVQDIALPCFCSQEGVEVGIVCVRVRACIVVVMKGGGFTAVLSGSL